MEDRGYRIWFDQGIEAGSEWSNNIAKHLRDCSAFVAFVSKHSMASENCLDEIAYAKSNNKPSLMIFLEENVILPEGVEMQTARFQRIYHLSSDSTESFVGKLEGAQLLSPCRGEDAHGYYAAYFSKYHIGTSTGKTNGKSRNSSRNKALPIILVSVLVVITVAVLLSGLWKDGGTNEKPKLTTQSSTSPSTTKQPDITTKDPETHKDTSKTDTQEPETTEVQTGTEPEKPELKLSDDLEDFTFELDGKVYALPMTYKELQSEGWTSMDASPEIPIGGREQYSISVIKNGKQLFCTVYNPSGDSRLIKDCALTKINTSTEYGLEITVAKGIKLGDSEEKVKEAFGVPTHYGNTVNGTTELRYLLKNGYAFSSSVTFFYGKNGYCSIVLDAIGNVENENTETKTEPPAYLDDYVRPTELGNDIFSGNVELFDGMIVKLPVPLREFLNNGWTVLSASRNYVVSKETMIAQIGKNGVTIDVEIKNSGDYQTTLENCIVHKIKATTSETEPQMIITLPGGISLGMKREELLSALPEDKFLISEEKYTTYCSYGADNIYRDVQKIRIQASKVTVDNREVCYHIEIESKTP